MWTTIGKWLLSNWKAVGKAASIVGAVVALYQLHDYVYEKGRADAQIELQAEYNQRVQEVWEKHAKATQDALDTLNNDMDDAVSRIRSSDKAAQQTLRVINNVKEQINIPAECDNLASDIARMLAEASNIGRSPNN